MMGLLVSIPEPEQAEVVVSEMIEVDSYEVGVISEMATDASKLASFGFSADVVSRAQSLAVANGDDTPEFPVVRVEEGWSNNNRLWDGEELVNIAEQVNALEPVAHWGHINKQNVAWEAPDPQTTWVGAIVKDEPSLSKENKGKLVKVFYAAGYNLPGAKVRTYIKSRAVKGVSWLAMGREIPVPGRGVQVRGCKLISLDWARKLAEGMPTSSIAAIASEQTEGGVMGELQLAAVTPEQFEKENPNGYNLIVAKVKAETDQVIAEMEEKVKTGDGFAKIVTELREKLGLGENDDPITAVANLMQRIGAEAGKLREKLLEKELLKRMPGDTDEAKQSRALVTRLVPVAEMDAKVADAKDDAAAEKIIGEMVEAMCNDDDQVKLLIGEMAPPVTRRREEFSRQGGEGANKNTYINES